jgi:hypothetical protein
MSFSVGEMKVELPPLVPGVRPNHWHVYPLREEHLHNLVGDGCQCDPQVTRYQNGGVLIVHNSAEQAQRKAN